LILLTGELGIGKTTLVESFANQAMSAGRALVARGQCVEHYGAGEAFLPWLDLLGDFARHHGAARLAALLRRYAPMWLAQMPWLIGASERATLQRELAGTTQDRMLRELAEALEAVGRDTPVVVILEDLHWSDQSSLGLLSYMARRREPARLMFVGTYRPSDVLPMPSPLLAMQQELQIHGQCHEQRLAFLSPDAVRDYLAARLPGLPDALAARIHARTDGSPLFMISAIEYLLAQGLLVRDGDRWRLREDRVEIDIVVPDSLREMIERRIERLSLDDQYVLEAASVAGVAFSGAAVAAALEDSTEAVEERLSALARRGAFVRRKERLAWPDGTHTDGYAFIHTLYQNVLYDRLGSSRSVRLHRRIGERLEAGFADRAFDVASELARHFRCGGDGARAVRYLAAAGENAIRRNAFVEAIALLTSGLELVTTFPEGESRDRDELQLQVPLGVSFLNNRGYGSQEAGDTFRRAYDLCRRSTDVSRLFRVLRGLWSFSVMRADLHASQAVAEELLLVAGRVGDRAGLVEGHRIIATNCFHLGRFGSALDHLEQGIALYDADHHSAHTHLFGQDPCVSGLSWRGVTLWHLGREDDALASGTRAIELARRIGHPFSLSYAMNFTAFVHQLRAEPELAERRAREGIRHAREQGFAQMLAMGQIFHGWAESHLGRPDEGIAELGQGAALWRSNGSRLSCPYWSCLIASALDAAGRRTEASAVLDGALAEMESGEERWIESHLRTLTATFRTPIAVPIGR